MLRRLAWLAVSGLLALNAAAAWWALAQSPFARPLVVLSAQAARDRIDRAMAAQATPDWLAARGEAALATDDADGIEMVRQIAADQGIALPPDLAARMAAWEEENSGFLNGTAACAACAWDVANCRSIQQLGACGLTVQLTPIGDVAALWRFGAAELAGEDPDWVDAGLGAVGVAATAGVLLTGGSSYTLKAGESVLRVSRRLGTLSAEMSARLRQLGQGVVDWQRMGEVATGQVAFREIADAGRMAELSRLATAIGEVRAETSLAETVHLARYVDSVEDAENLARVAAAEGPRTRHALEVLGKPRTFRLLHRVSDLAILTIGLITTLMASLVSLALTFALRLLNILLRPRHRRHRPLPLRQPGLRRGAA